jgi:hypothetical protein
MEPWPYAAVNIVAGVAGGLAYIFFAAVVGGPPNNPLNDVAILTGFEALALLIANGLAISRNTAIRRAEQRWKQQWTERHQGQK